MRRMLTYLCVAVLACGCGLDEPALSDVGGSPIEFSASKLRIITKSGDTAEPFAEGTKLNLFAVQTGTDWSAEGTKFYNKSGTVESSGKVSYGEKASYDVGRNLDFYGVTYGSVSSPVQVSGEAGSSPVVYLSLSDNVFPDLMYSDNLKNKNSSSGLLTMEFRHTLSKLKFEVLKQDESGDVEKKLEDVVLKKVVLKGSATSASFDVRTGEWSYATSVTGDRIVYENASGLKIESSAQFLKSGEDAIEMLAVPNSGQLSLEITVDLDGDSSTPDDKVLTHDLMSSETEKMVLEQNKEYTFSIVVLKNDVRIVTVTPQIYEWVDVDLDTDDAYFGQPVYFAGLMWMDRNLGASSADCENDWYNTLGYYYQFGRNIPYILDLDAVKNGTTSFKRIAGTSDNDPASVWDMRFFYTYDENSQKVTTAKYANHPSGECYYDKLAKTPGEPGEYSYIIGFVHDSQSNKTQSWAITEDSFSDSKNENQSYWSNVENQPCPKGWRLPTKDDLYSFMPEDNKLLWDEKYVIGEDMISSGKHKFSGDKSNSGKWDYEWSYFAGVLKVDPDADKAQEFSSPISDPEGHSRVYGIKFVGENRAYRVMFERIPSKNALDKDYVRISRFDTYTTDEFILNDDGTQWNLHKFDWSTPAEYMDIPLCGYVYKSLNMDGAILRTSDAPLRDGLNWVLYLRSGSNGVCVTYSSRRNLGENIRCVRDVNAK